MIGQRRVKRLAKLGLRTGKNLLISGPSGHGKSMLAREISVSYHRIILGEPEPPMEILENFMWNIPSRVLVCDEIHISRDGGLWPVFLDSFLGVVIFTTTNPERVIEAIKTRCLIIELEDYSPEDLIQISGVDSPEIAELSRGIPRKAKNLGDLFNRFNAPIEEFCELLDMQEYQELLLFPEEVKYLDVLSSGCKGERVLRSLLNLGNFEEVELGLLRLGLIEITREGRCLTK